ncbi:hypothetical protein BH09MYX1_BH09MYX1_00180 [soil metagenome]
MFKQIALTVASFALVTVAACAKESNTASSTTPSGNTSTTGASGDGIVTNSLATGKITGARCAREDRCNNVGAGKKYDNSDACIKEVGQNTMSDLKDSECAGVVTKELDECLDEVKNQACNNPIDAITRVAACTRAQLCR